MCGLTGFWGVNHKLTTEQAKPILADMIKPIHHRGPDDHGLWFQEKQGLGFGHTRLAIVDLSTQGHQPMHSQSGKGTIVYNGEIYNADTIRRELIDQHQIAFKGHSDTEVLLEACEAWGVEHTLKKINGMFAFAFWSETEATLTLARDRLGIKPLYWGLSKGVLLFGSQLKSLKSHPNWQGELCPTALHHYFQLGYVPAPLSIFKGIYKLAPGCLIHFKLPLSEKITPNLSTQYWCPKAMTQQPLVDMSDGEQIQALDDLLSDAVGSRMIADVPLGAFLSGGIDSSLVAALMQKQSRSPIKTFSIGFDNPQYNEAGYAKKVAEHLGTDHHETILSAKDALAFVPNMPEWYDEPFADSSQIPTFLVSQIARKHVTVALSGDGGDELFAGYSRYHMGYRLWSRMSKLPSWSKTALSHTLTTLPISVWDKLSLLIPASKRPKQLGRNAHKMASIMHCDSLGDFYQHLVGCWQDPTEIIATEIVIAKDQENTWSWPEPPKGLSPIARMQWLDTVTYLPDDILTKVDRASMAVSLEARVPLLDHRVVAFAWQLPESSKIRSSHRQVQSKWLLRQVLKQYIPEALFNRPKMGFGIPLADWLRGPLHPWATNLLSEQSLDGNPYINTSSARKIWHEHLNHIHNHEHRLWTLLMFLAWYQHWHQSHP